MKKVLASLLAAYTLTNGQAPPPADVVNPITNPIPPVEAPPVEIPAVVPPVEIVPPAIVPPVEIPSVVTPIEAVPVVVPIEAVPPAEVPAVVPPVPIATAARLVQQTTQAASVAVVPDPAAIDPVPVTPMATPLVTSAATLPLATPPATNPIPLVTTAPIITTTAPVTVTRTPPQPNPFCPAGSGVGKQSGPRSQDQACTILGQLAQDYMGVMRCNDYSCCMCEHITCGYLGYPCTAAQFGDYGAIGAKSIWVDGKFSGNGATLECDGLRGCKDAKIVANYLWKGSFAGDYSGENVDLQIYNPGVEMELSISGQYALKDGSIEVLIGQPGTRCPPVAAGNPGILEIGQITLNGLESGLNAKIAIRNYGCSQVLIRNLECAANSCPNTEFVLEGNIMIESCALPGLTNVMNLPAVLFPCVSGAIPIGQPITPGAQLPPPFQPLPQAQPPVTPVTPVDPLPVNPAVNPVPVNPLPVNPFPGQQQPPFGPPTGGLPPKALVPILAPGSNSKLNCDNQYTMCSGQEITLQVENNFVLECAGRGTCQGMTLNLELGVDPHSGLIVEGIDSLKFIGYDSGMGTTINIIDARPNKIPGMPSVPLHLGDMRCENPGSCWGVTINAGPGIDLMGMNRDCSEPHYCERCSINQGGFTMPCANPRQMQMPQQPLAYGAPGGQWV